MGLEEGRRIGSATGFEIRRPFGGCGFKSHALRLISPTPSQALESKSFAAAFFVTPRVARAGTSVYWCRAREPELPVNQFAKQFTAGPRPSMEAGIRAFSDAVPRWFGRYLIQKIRSHNISGSADYHIAAWITLETDHPKSDNQ